MDRRAGEWQTAEILLRRSGSGRHDPGPPFSWQGSAPRKRLRGLREEAESQWSDRAPLGAPREDFERAGGADEEERVSHSRRRGAAQAGDIPQRMSERTGGKFRSGVSGAARRNLDHRDARAPKVF